MTLPPSLSQAIVGVLNCSCKMRSELMETPLPPGFPETHYADCLTVWQKPVLAALEPIWKAEIEAAEEAVVQDVSDEWIKRLRETTALAHDTFGKANLLVRATFQRGALARHDERTRRETLDAAIEELQERMTREEYGHAKSAVALDIEAIRALGEKP